MKAIVDERNMDATAQNAADLHKVFEQRYALDGPLTNYTGYAYRFA